MTDTPCVSVKAVCVCVTHTHTVSLMVGFCFWCFLVIRTLALKRPTLYDTAPLPPLGIEKERVERDAELQAISDLFVRPKLAPDEKRVSDPEIKECVAEIDGAKGNSHIEEIVGMMTMNLYFMTDDFRDEEMIHNRPRFLDCLAKSNQATESELKKDVNLLIRAYRQIFGLEPGQQRISRHSIYDLIKRGLIKKSHLGLMTPTTQGQLAMFKLEALLWPCIDQTLFALEGKASPMTFGRFGTKGQALPAKPSVPT